MNDTEESANYAGRRLTAVHKIIILNIIVWVLWQFAASNEVLARFMSQNFLVSWDGVLRDGRVHTLFTSTISHMGIWHIAFNMAFFYWIADEVETIYGHRNFYFFYFIAGVISSVAYVGIDYLQMSARADMGIPALGASGAIMGIAVAAAFYNPSRPVNLFFVLTLPLRWVVIAYIVLDLLGVFSKGADPYFRSGIAHTAHLGGALAGLIFYKFDLRVFGSPGRNQVGLWFRVKRFFRRKPRLRMVEREEIPRELPRQPVAAPARSAAAASGAPARGRVDVDTSRRVDELLGKISREGIDALTDEERSFLKESSQKYKR
ncbi:MAG TPA: rhomboid family intramembrane serine protease [Planctomycetota bacterium]|jgi:membrane associated rhomboid family serine protease